MPETRPSNITLQVRRRILIRSLFLVIVALLVLSSAGQIAKHGFGYANVFGLVSFTYLDAENNLPTWYASVQLLACAVLLALIAVGRHRSGDRWTAHWIGLAVIFTVMSLDEMGSIHERLIEPTARLVDTFPGVLKPYWVIPVLAVVALVSFAYMRFVLEFPRRDRLQIFAAAAVFLGGAIGMEMISASQFDTTDPLFKEQPRYVVLAHVEEFMEKIGVLIFLDFLLRQIAEARTSYSIAATD